MSMDNERVLFQYSLEKGISELKTVEEVQRFMRKRTKQGKEIPRQVGVSG